MSNAEEIAGMWEVEMRKGYTKLAVLMFLNKKALTGYDIMKEIEEETFGFWKLTSGGVYPVLKELEERGYIKGQWKAKGERRKKIYKITDDGKQMLKTALYRQQQMEETIGELFRQFAQEVLGTKLPSLPPTPFKLLPFGKNLEEKPLDEQIRILKSFRTRMRQAIKLIDKRLQKLEGLK
jgi:PadR family transcriptional regulator PadR